MTIWAAMAAGLLTSLHCVGMCGPLACGLGALAKSEGERLTAASLYHGSRLFSYGLVGAVCGAIGSQPLRWFFDSPAVLLPWALVLLLVLVGFGLDKKLPRPPALRRFAARLRFRVQGLPPRGAALTLGFFTPLLPCGPLYALFAASLLTGSAAKGAEVALAFGLGTVPLLWLAQHQFHRIRAKLSPAATRWLKPGFALLAAALLVWRLGDTLPGATPASGNEAGEAASATGGLPSCCH